MSWLQNQQLTVVCVGWDLCATEELSQQEGVRIPPLDQQGGHEASALQEKPPHPAVLTLTRPLGSSMPPRGPRATCPWYLGAQAWGHRWLRPQGPQ